MAMCEPLQNNSLKTMESQKLIYSQVAFLVNLLASPEGELAKRMTGISGLKCFASWEKLGQGGYWARMSQDSCQLLMFPGEQGEHLEPYCTTWPRWGTVLDGVATELVMSERRTKGIGCSSQGALATHSEDVSGAVMRRWPTPKSTVSGPDYARMSRVGTGDDLATAVARNWSTPSAYDCTGSHGGGQSSSLRTDIHNMKVKTGQQGQLNPDWVECLMGFPIGWTEVEMEKPQDWPGWPAPLMGGNWKTPQCFDATTGDLKGKEYTGKNRHALKLGNCINAETGQYPYEPPRVISGQKNRAKRLKCCGNAVSPYQIKPIFDAIVAIEEGRIA